MKICCFTDPHWCEFSSIVRENGKNFSLRLENLVNSIRWVISLAKERECGAIVCCGDFFDKETLNSRELTALSTIDFESAGIPFAFIVGNHEMGNSDLSCNSASLFNIVTNSATISSPKCWSVSEDTEVWFLPYILEANRKPLSDYIGGKSNKKKIVLSHNDIKGIEMGVFVSEEGFSIEEIEDCCDLFVNGHIHNFGKIGSKGINLGNLTGQNFSENAEKYEHYAMIIDTDNVEDVELVTNPFAFNFYKIDATKWQSFGDLQLKNNSVVSITCMEEHHSKVKEMVENCKNIVASRIIVQRNIINSETAEKEQLPELNITDHIGRFKEFILNTVGNDAMIVSELGQVLK